MIIVAGRLYVDAAAREAYLAECREIIVQARNADGCLDFHLTADPIGADRINVFEQWESVSALEAFRQSGPSSAQASQIRAATVFQHEVASTHQL